MSSDRLIRRTVAPGRRLAMAGLLALAVGACGFTPAYAPGGPGAEIAGRVEPREPGNAIEFAFVEQFEARLGRAPGGPLILAYEIETSEDELAITADQEIQRYNLVGKLTYSVTEGSGGRVLRRSEIDDFTSYSAIGTTVATRASQTDATRRLAVILADRLVTELVATAGSWAP